MGKKRKRKNAKPRPRSAKRGGLKTKYIGVLILYLAFAISFVSVSIILQIAKIINPPCANSISCIKDLSGVIERHPEGVFLGRKIVVPSYVADGALEKKVLGETSAKKHIFVDLTNQRLYAHEDGKKVFEFPVSTGKWGRTPTGNFRIWIKLAYTRMAGGSGNDYYNLPNVPHTMFFYSDQVSKSRGFALHGAYWHNNFGYPMSHGCVNIRPTDAAKLYEWADPLATGKITHATSESPGTMITIYGETPT